jgi:ceramide glucosyltransferase
MIFLAGIGWLFAALAVVACAYTLAGIVAVRRFIGRPHAPVVAPEAATLLKPLHGAEPRLADNLATCLAQDWAASIEMVAGVGAPGDGAVAALATLPQGPWREVRLVADARRHGANAKVGNLCNMMAAASHDLLVLSDSDMAVPPDYLARIAAALAEPGVGAVTCLYRGRGDAGFWSVMAAAAVSYGFLPQVAVSHLLGDRQACMGSTIALRRQTLAAIGGFGAFADTLADDHAIGAAVRARGLMVAMPPMLLVHASTERSLAALVRHELRWAATVRDVIPAGQYAGLALTQPLGPALVAAALLAPAGWPGVAAALALAAIACRAALALVVDRACGARTMAPWLLPARDLLSSAVFVASIFVRSVDWRGQRLRMEGGGRIAASELS